MNMFIAGATGILGRRLVRVFAQRCAAATALVRSDRGTAAVRGDGGTPVRADLFCADSLSRVARGAEVLIHAATAIPTTGARRRRAWLQNDRIRREGTHALSAAAAAVGARLYLQQSVVWVVRSRGDAAFDEDTPPQRSRLVRSAVDGERLARDTGARAGMAVGVLRCGVQCATDDDRTRRTA